MPVISKDRSAPARSRLLAGLRAWREDQGGATLVQFIAVLPVFVLVIIGSYAMFKVMAARDTLCEATWEATRYLQVEGPHFPKDDPAFQYPTGWEQIAVEIMNQELASRTLVGLYPIDETNVDLWPDDPRNSPQSTIREGRQELDQNLFYMQVTRSITNPLGIFFDLPNEEPGKIKLTCRMGGFFEGPPVLPTLLRPPPNTGPDCPRPIAICPPGSGTNTPIPSEGTPTVCPVCR